jgi:hypothetical protein
VVLPEKSNTRGERKKFIKQQQIKLGCRVVTWVCPSGTCGLVYRVWPIKEVDKYKDSKMTWSRRRKTLIRIRLGYL